MQTSLHQTKVTARSAANTTTVVIGVVAGVLVALVLLAVVVVRRRRSRGRVRTEPVALTVTEPPANYFGIPPTPQVFFMANPVYKSSSS